MLSHLKKISYTITFSLCILGSATIGNAGDMRPGQSEHKRHHGWDQGHHYGQHKHHKHHKHHGHHRHHGWGEGHHKHHHHHHHHHGWKKQNMGH